MCVGAGGGAHTENRYQYKGEANNTTKKMYENAVRPRDTLNYFLKHLIRLLYGACTKETRWHAETDRSKNLILVYRLKAFNCIESECTEIVAFTSRSASTRLGNDETVCIEESLKLFDIVSVHTRFKGTGEAERVRAHCCSTELCTGNCRLVAWDDRK